jgi:hypothetical protein
MNAAAALNLQAAPHDPVAELTVQTAPAVIQQSSTAADPTGSVGTLNLGGPTYTQDNAFFQNLGTNGRTCFTCHQPGSAWGIGVDAIVKSFASTNGKAPIFRPVDGATCPTDDTSTLAAKAQAYSLLITKGLIRIGLPVPDGAAFTVSVASDPYGCALNPTTGIVSTYRRPLPSANLGFLPPTSLGFANYVMWDGREPSLSHQATDATLGHAQAAVPPTDAQVAQIVAFEANVLNPDGSLAPQGIFTAQQRDAVAGPLNAKGALGGPANLAMTLASLFPQTATPPLGGFNLFDAWALLNASDNDKDAARASILRGELIFNNTPLPGATVAFCTKCHNNPNVGSNATATFFNTHIADSPTTVALQEPVLDVSGMPLFNVTCTATGVVTQVTDIGHAMVTGACADIGKFKAPVLRGLAARAPYFHNGSAATIDDIVTFYEQHFGFPTAGTQGHTDMVNFLSAL